MNNLSRERVGEEFTSGDAYQYCDVPEHLYREFIQASSHGQYLADYIKDNYRY